MSRIKITATVRAAVRELVKASREYDAESMRIGHHGTVTAIKDHNKVPGIRRNYRYCLGKAADMVRQDGTPLEGF